MSGEPELIYARMIDAMRKIEPIKKARKNPHFGYNFRGIDDIYDCVGPVLAECGVFPVPRVLDKILVERQTSTGKPMQFATITMEYQFTAEDGSHVDAQAVGVGMDTEDKACNKAMSVALREVCVKTFCIPLAGDVDPERDNIEPAPAKPAAPAPASARDIGNGRLEIVASIDAISHGTTKKGGDKWGLRCGEVWYNTFDKAVAERAQELREAGKPARIEYETGKYGNVARAIGEATDLPTPDAAPPDPPEATVTTDILDVSFRMDQKGKIWDVKTPLGVFSTRDDNMAADISQRKGRVLTVSIRDYGAARKLTGWSDPPAAEGEPSF